MTEAAAQRNEEAVHVFVSYAREDRDVAARLAARLTGKGWKVWWDREIPLGRDYDDVIEKALATTRCVVVLWSHSSAASRFVKAEARVGLERDILVPVLIDDVRPPLEFRALQAAQLEGWNGDPGHPELIKLEQRIRELAGDSGPVAAESFVLEPALARRGPNPKRRVLAWLLAGAGAATVAIGTLVATQSQKPPIGETTKAVAATVSHLPAAGKPDESNHGSPPHSDKPPVREPAHTVGQTHDAGVTVASNDSSKPPVTKHEKVLEPEVIGNPADVRGSLGTESIRRVVQHHIGEVRSCYDLERLTRPDPRGRIMVQFTISASGQVIASVLKSSTVGNPRLENCVVQAVRRWDFPKPPGGGIVIVSYPFVLPLPKPGG